MPSPGSAPPGSPSPDASGFAAAEAQPGGLFLAFTLPSLAAARPMWTYRAQLPRPAHEGQHLVVAQKIVHPRPARNAEHVKGRT